jgi:hypothetical protein
MKKSDFNGHTHEHACAPAGSRMMPVKGLKAVMILRIGSKSVPFQNIELVRASIILRVVHGKRAPGFLEFCSGN